MANISSTLATQQKWPDGDSIEAVGQDHLQQPGPEELSVQGPQEPQVEG